jgi:DNA-directed RNA polymerase specialized sigma24 family protein
MGGGGQPSDRSFHISPVDRLGRRISAVVLEAAEEIGRRAIHHAEKLLIDPAVATSQLEQAAATVSRAIEARKRCNRNEVRDLHSYLFRAFIRRINRIKKRQIILDGAIHELALGSHNSTDPRVSLELKILVDELLTRCDPVTRDMFYRRLQGFSWREISLLYGISDHAAESRFSQALRRIAENLGLRKDS